MARTIIARNETVTESEVIARVPVGSIVRYTYTYEGTEYVCRGRVTGHEGEQVNVDVTYHQEFGTDPKRQMKMMWSARFCTMVRRAR